MLLLFIAWLCDCPIHTGLVKNRMKVSHKGEKTWHKLACNYAFEAIVSCSGFTIIAAFENPGVYVEFELQASETLCLTETGRMI